MYSRSLLNDIREMELFFGIVPTYGSGLCDKLLEVFEGQPLPFPFRCSTCKGHNQVKDYHPPLYEIELTEEGEIKINNLGPISFRDYAEEIGIVQMEDGPNSGVYYF